MIPPIPKIENYGITEKYGFLPPELPIDKLSDPYYEPWEAIASNLQALIRTRRIRDAAQKMPILSTSHLHSGAEWRRAYVILAFITHAYIWSGECPEERIPASISIPLLQVCHNLELPPVATYSGVCLWNFRLLFKDEPVGSLENLVSLLTFTGSLDESWFYLVSVAIEARGGPIISLMLHAIEAARVKDTNTVISALQIFAESLDEIRNVLERMNENCDPAVFYHRIRPFLAGSRNMAEAGLPRGVLYEDGTGVEEWRQYGGGSNAQSSLIQFFDLVLGITHRPTGEGPQEAKPTRTSSEDTATAPPPQHNFIQDMQSYMPGPHRRFLTDVAAVANIRAFVEADRDNRALTLAYDACLVMLRNIRDTHIQLVTRYVVVQSRDATSNEGTTTPSHLSEAATSQPVNLATATKNASDDESNGSRGGMRGTGGTALIPFLKQARDETAEPAIDAWARRLLGDAPVVPAKTLIVPEQKLLVVAATKRAEVVLKGVELGIVCEHANGDRYIVGLAGTWGVDQNDAGGICHW